MGAIEFRMPEADGHLTAQIRGFTVKPPLSPKIFSFLQPPDTPGLAPLASNNTRQINCKFAVKTLLRVRFEHLITPASPRPISNTSFGGLTLSVNAAFFPVLGPNGVSMEPSKAKGVRSEQSDSMSCDKARDFPQLSL